MRKFLSLIGKSRECGLLQWGRNFIVAEISDEVASQGRHNRASMGPQLYRCGNKSMDSDYDARKYALQWGRNFIVAEISLKTSAVHIRYATLQWGRNFIVAEICAHNFDWGLPLHASMGPQLYRCGNSTQHLELKAEKSRFNGAATLSLRKWHLGADNRLRL